MKNGKEKENSQKSEMENFEENEKEVNNWNGVYLWWYKKKWANDRKKPINGNVTVSEALTFSEIKAVRNLMKAWSVVMWIS